MVLVMRVWLYSGLLLFDVMQWMSMRPGETIPPWACRTGLSVPVVTTTPKGQVLVPFSITTDTKVGTEHYGL